MIKKIVQLMLILFLLMGCTFKENSFSVSEDQTYTSKEKVALYLHTFQQLPSNYITKQEAMVLGWVDSKGNLWEVTDQKSIGGDRFLNLEGKLPNEKGLKYFEADIEYQGGFRNAKRIVYGTNGKIYFTDDHYQTFEELY